MLAWGYFYGILRANIISPFSHFLFDSSVAGLYSAVLFQKNTSLVSMRTKALSDWMFIICAWTFLLALIPIQEPLITLVGLRGNLYFVPMLLLGARLQGSDLTKLVPCLAALNIVAFAFAVAEFNLGIERFYPISAVTDIIYMSKDAGQGKYRIPAIFSNAHSYAGTQVATLPMLLTAVSLPAISRWRSLLCLVGSFCCVAGVLLASTRMNFVVGGLMLAIFVLRGKMSVFFKATIVAVMLTMVIYALSNERFQRFKTLENTDMVAERISGSVNRSFIEVITEYPLGNGLGGGGTSIPHFLLHQLRRPMAVENEYARIALELGIPGLLIWSGFIAWIVATGIRKRHGDPWSGGRILIWVLLCIQFVIALIGTGLLTAIPATALLFILAGWLVTAPAQESDPDNSQIDP